MSNIENSTLTQLTEQICFHSREWLSADSLLSGSPQQIVRKWSLMLRYQFSDGKTRTAVLVKITRNQGSRIEDAIKDTSLLPRTNREYEMLRSVEMIFSRNDYKTSYCYIRPLAVLEKWNALVTEELDCKPLKSYLLRAPMLFGFAGHWNIFLRLLERSARWLSIYHQGMGPQDYVKVEHSGVKEMLEKHLEDISDLLAGGAVDIRNITDWVISSSQDIQIPMAVLHGDFHCSNLLVTPDMRVGSLDAECVRGSIYEDISKLLIDLETRSLQIYSLGALIPARRMERCRNAILSGYFGSNQANRSLLELFIILAILQKWKIDEDLLIHSSFPQRIVRGFLTPVRRWYMKRILIEHLNNLAAEIQTLKPTKSMVAA